eukprot:TRINITY_DN1875_c0_g1_i1.p1 TRINITY_DN1875_c0_g1~~TRINITY_DN1875_c0_g1_i1.p1  ORF type:complete len:259 (-),score=48.73 TRINITY_DN1875_c0_g1_i1:55-831(-)
MDYFSLVAVIPPPIALHLWRFLVCMIGWALYLTTLHCVNLHAFRRRPRSRPSSPLLLATPNTFAPGRPGFAVDKVLNITHGGLSFVISVAAAVLYIDWHVEYAIDTFLQNDNIFYWILTFSFAYFIIDTVHDIWYVNSTLFVLHHVVAMVTILCGAWFRVTSGAVMFLASAEVGGVLFNLSRLVSRNRTLRLVYLCVYGLSRFVMLGFPTVVVGDLAGEQHMPPRWSVVGSVLGFAVCGLNLQFLYKQILKFQRDFSR